MKKKLCAVAVLGIAITAISTNANELGESLEASVKASASSSHGPLRYQTANVFDTAVGPGRRLGASWLIRSRNHIRGRIMTNVPTAGDAYTLWAIVFNNPSACDGPCNDPDIANPKVRASVYNASGAISSSNGLGGGVVNIDFEMDGGKLPNDLFVLVGEPRGLLRNRGFRAEVHLVVDQHPPIAIGGDSWIADLTTTNFPGTGPVVSVAASILVACTERSCPESVL